MLSRLPRLVCVLLMIAGTSLPAAGVKVTLDVSEVPELKEWGETARQAMVEWYPRISNLLASEGFQPPTETFLKIEKSEKGVGYSSGKKIVLSSSWIKKHPDDVGLVIHEMTHVIQSYPSKNPGWVTEGIADYIRWAIFEGHDLSKFPVPKDKDGYKKGYKPAAGFFLWLESGKAPGIVRRLNSAMRQSDYREDIFEQQTGMTLKELWRHYQVDRDRS